MGGIDDGYMSRGNGDSPRLAGCESRGVPMAKAGESVMVLSEWI